MLMHSVRLWDQPMYGSTVNTILPSGMGRLARIATWAPHDEMVTWHNWIH